jgi:hypothetical protein
MSSIESGLDTHNMFKIHRNGNLDHMLVIMSVSGVESSFMYDFIQQLKLLSSSELLSLVTCRRETHAGHLTISPSWAPVTVKRPLHIPYTSVFTNFDISVQVFGISQPSSVHPAGYRVTDWTTISISSRLINQ